MKMQMKLGALLVAGAWVITGCGGGGGGAPSTVQINGTAAKGILIGADVRVYGLSAGEKSEKPLATAKTGPDGRYTLDIAPTTEPVLIEVEVNDTTTMLDETKALVGGQFPPVAAPKGLVLRSFAADASKLTVVRVNPLTEMAVAVAESTGQLSLNSLIAGQDMAILASPDGVNPFAQEPIAKPADMDENQLKFAMFNAGLLSSMTANCDLRCRIGELSEGVSISLDADGKASYTEQVERDIHERKAAVLTAGANLKVDTDKQAAVTSLSQSVIAAANNAAVNASGGTTRDPSVVIAANGLQGFVDAMREGFRVTEDRLLKVEKELDERYKDVTLEGTSYIGNVLDEIDMACTKVDDTLSCTSGLTRGFTWTRVSENTFTWQSTSPNDGRTSTGTVVGSVKNGLDTLSVNGSIVKDGQELVTMTGIELGHQEKGDAEFHTKINGTLQAKDDKGLVVTLKFDNVDMKSVPRASNTALADMTFKGGLTLEANNGDKLTGAIDLTMVEVTRQINNGYQVNDSFVTLGRINLKAVTATTNVLALDVSFTTSLPDYMQDESKTNYQTSDATLKLVLTDSLTLTFTEKSNQWDTVNLVATIKSGISEIELSAEYKSGYTVTTGKWCRESGGGGGGGDFSSVPTDQGSTAVYPHHYRCASEIKLRSTNANPYTATLIKGTNGKTQGDIFLGSTKVGEFVNGVLKINGSEVSIY